MTASVPQSHRNTVRRTRDVALIGGNRRSTDVHSAPGYVILVTLPAAEGAAAASVQEAGVVVAPAHAGRAGVGTCHTNGRSSAAQIGWVQLNRN